MVQENDTMPVTKEEFGSVAPMQAITHWWNITEALETVHWISQIYAHTACVIKAKIPGHAHSKRKSVKENIKCFCWGWEGKAQGNPPKAGFPP